MKDKYNLFNIFDLKFLGLGQHVSLKQKPEDLETTIAGMKNQFCLPNSDESNPLPSNLHFDKNNEWLIGFQFKLLDFIDISAVFNDPNLYGLFIALEGDKADTLKGFQFAIRYEKGAYKGKIALPDNMRRLEFGAVTVILPEFYIELYSNGDYKVDVGFPTNLDFSRSLTVEALPYKGAGGFYIARLSPGASIRGPQTDKGQFSPIIEFGIGMELGVGKSIEKGVLKAGLSLTLLGVLEGALAFYEPKEGNEGEGERYHWLQGTFGVSGMLYGEVDLSLVVARVEALVQAISQVTLQSYRATPIVFKINVSARADIECGFGIGKYTITKTFNKEVDADFLIGKDSKGPWEKKLLPTVEELVRPMKWQPLILDDDEKRDLNLHFLPHLTIADEKAESNSIPQREAIYSAMTYIDSSSQNDSSFKKLIEAILVWTINAYVNSDKNATTLDFALKSPVCDDDLGNIYKYLVGYESSQTLIVYQNPENNEDIVSFLSNYFNIHVCHPELPESCENKTKEIPVSFFPILPDLELIVEHSKAENPEQTEVVHEADFTSYNKCNKEYLTEIKEYIQHLLVSYQTVTEQEHDEKSYQKASFIEGELSMATRLFPDFITMVAKAMIQESRECIGECTTVNELVNKVLSHDRVTNIAAMTTRYMLHGMRVPGIGKTAYSSLTETHPIYKLVGQQFTIPNVKPGDKLFLTLKNKNGLKVNFKQCQAQSDDNVNKRLKIEVPVCEMDRIRHVKNVTLNNLGTVNPLKTSQEVCSIYSFKNPINWNADEKLCFFTEPLTKALENNSILKLKKSKPGEISKEVSDYTLSTIINVEIRKIPESTNFFSYDVVGADEKDRGYLERLIAYLNTLTHLSDIIDSIHVLYSLKGQDGLRSEENAEVRLVKTNLSTETNPGMMTDSSKNKQFIERLFQSSLVRSGGFYLNYCNKNSVANEGIPEEIFGEGGKGKISIVIKYQNGTLFSSFMNSIVLKSKLVDENESLFFEDQTQKNKIPAFPPGHVGFEVQRNQLISGDLEKEYVAQQFNLVGFTLCENNWFKGQPPSPLPIGAANESPQKDLLYYRTVFPIAKFAQDHSSVLAVGDWDPYAGIGGKARIKLHLQDLFGNQLSQPIDYIEPPVCYRDFLVPIHQWPSMKLEYEFLGGLRPKIHINFIFNNEKYKCGIDPRQCEKAKENAKLDKEIYRKIYYQLIQSDVEIYFISSLTKSLINPEGSKACVDKNTLVEYVKRIFSFLDSVGSDNLQDVPPYPIEQEIIMTNEEPIFELNLCLIIERTKLEHIDDEFKDIEVVRRTSTKVWPKVVYNQNQDPLYDFTVNFEHIFKSKIAIGTTLEDVSHQGEKKKIWVVHFDQARNMHYEIGKDAYFYAPIPISKSKKTFKGITITPFKGDPFIKDFPNVDLDLWAKDCLSYIDQILAPKYAVAAYRVDEGQTLNDILVAKEKIAEAITSTVTHIGNLKRVNVEYNLDEAKEKFKQQVLIRLSNAYDIDTIIQHPVYVHSPYENIDGAPEAPRLYGTLTGNLLNSYRVDREKLKKDQSNQEYSFSPAKVPLKNGTSWLTYLFTTKQDGEYQRYQFQDMKYQISYIEHEIHNVPNIGKYKASSWLSFIIPWKDEIDKGMGSLEIPIPLRAYPVPPSLEAHQSIYRPRKIIPLSETRNWNYEYSYKQTLEVQDRVKTKVELNVKKEDAWFIDESEVDRLGKELAQFRHSWPEIKIYLDTKLGDSLACSGFEDEVEVFRKLSQDLNNLANAWYHWATNTNKLTEIQANNEIELYYDIVESAIQPNDENSALCITIKSKQSDFQLPLITINEYETECIAPGVYKFYQCLDEEESISETCRNKKYLLYKDRKKNTTRTVSLRNLDILNIRHAWAGVYLTRNESLFDGCDCIYESTNEKFLYQTELAKMANQITPFLVNEQLIDISALSGEPLVRSLEDHLTNMVVELLRDPTIPGLRYSKEHVIKGCIGYQFNLVSGSTNLPKITIPSLLTLPFQYDIDGEAVVKDLAGKMLSIFTTRPDGPEPSVGTFVIDVAVYDKKENELPMLKLKNMYLNVDKILELRNL